MAINRAFLSLYLVIVLSVIVVGWGADQLWDAYDPAAEVSAGDRAILGFLDAELQGMPYGEQETRATALSDATGQSLTLFQLEEIAMTPLGERIALGEPVVVFDDSGRKSLYRRVANSETIVRVSLDEVHPESRIGYWVLLACFYGGIALVVYVWVWPLARDLRRLQAHTQRVGMSGETGEVELLQSSAVFPLARAFNTMSERIRELLKSHKEMTYAVSHELRTPLARTKFALEMAEDAKDKIDLQKQLASVREDVREMDSLINELLTYASFEQQEAGLDCQPGDLGALLATVVDGESGDSKAAGPEVVLKPSTLTLPICAEWYLLERCCHNLLQNAKKHARASINVSFGVDHEDAWVAVDDDGQGISEEDREKIFEAFVRLRKNPHDNKSGFGLGLAIVQRIMKWHDGEVRVEDSPLGGARFILRWPGAKEK